MRLRLDQLRELLEAAMTLGTLPPNVKFFETGDGSTHYMYLLDANEMPDVEAALLGGISITTLGGSWHVGSVSAHEGYGPLMYRLAMEWVGENGRGRGLTRNPGETSDAAKRIWQKFNDPQHRVGLKSHPTDDPMRPEMTAYTGDLKKVRSRWIDLSKSQVDQAWNCLIDLSIGGQRGYDEEG